MRSSGLRSNLRQDEINSLGNRKFRNFDQLIPAPAVDLQRQWILRQRIFKAVSSFLVLREDFWPRRRNEHPPGVAVDSCGLTMMLQGADIQQSRPSDRFWNPAIKKYRTGSLHHLFENVHVAGEQKLSKFGLILPRGRIASDANLLADDPASHLVDAQKPAPSQGIDEGGLPTARAPGNHVEVASFHSHKIFPAERHSLTRE